jgi:hydrogenase maturation protease
MKDVKTDPVAPDNYRGGSNRILLIGIGNCGRGDDGLGWEFTDMLRRYDEKLIDFEYRYQLQIEDSCIVCKYGTVIFVDASHDKTQYGFEIQKCTLGKHYYFSSHIQSPETILYLANDLYNKQPHAYTLAIEGSYWDLRTSLSSEAEKNLQLAFNSFINDFLPRVLNRNTSIKNC